MSQLEVMCLAVISNGYSAHLVKSDIRQNNDDIEITKEQYYYLLDVNNNKQAEIRVIELEDGTLAVKDFYNPRPSFFHFWNRKTQEWEISKEDQEKQQIEKNQAFLSTETKRVSRAIATLDDAVEFGIATDEEIALHKELRMYRVLLSRVPTQEGWPLKVEWPKAPEF